MELPLLGEITMFAGNFAPRGWAFCSGQLLAISQNDALYALIGTTYGGDGVNTFALPNLAGRVPIHVGTTLGKTFILGQSGGVESVTLTTQQLPAHSHNMITSEVSFSTRGDSAGNSASPDNNFIAQAPLKKFFGRETTSDKMAPLESAVIVGNAGNSIAHNNMQPYCAINFIIALEGVFPSSN